MSLVEKERENKERKTRLVELVIKVDKLEGSMES